MCSIVIFVGFRLKHIISFCSIKLYHFSDILTVNIFKSICNINITHSFGLSNRIIYYFMKWQYEVFYKQVLFSGMLQIL